MLFTKSLLISLVLLSISLCGAQLKWKKITPTTSILPPGRRDHALGFDGKRNRLVIFGGRNQSHILDDTWEYDLTANVWNDVTAVKRPEKRFSFVYGISGDYLYISTGQEVGAILYDDIWKFNLASNEWTKIQASGKKPGTVYGAAGGFYSNTSTKFYVTHGFSASKRYASTHVFDIETNTWEEAFGDESSYIYGHPNARCLAAGTMVDEDKLLMYGGCLTGGQTGGACPAFDSWLFDGKKKTWKQFDYCASPRNYPSIALLPVSNGKRKAVLYGGSEGGKSYLQFESAEADQIAVLDVEDSVWKLKRAEGSDIPDKRVGAAMIHHPQVCKILNSYAMLSKQDFLITKNLDNVHHVSLKTFLGLEISIGV